MISSSCLFLLDLISPEAVELAPNASGVVPDCRCASPEFQILETDGAISRLMSEEKDKTEAKERLFAGLSEEEQPLAKKLISHLSIQDNKAKEVTMFAGHKQRTD